METEWNRRSHRLSDHSDIPSVVLSRSPTSPLPLACSLGMGLLTGRRRKRRYGKLLTGTVS
ncbi:uncharacterized protein [Physcomitrium patens]|uniref:uncharacterized protein isoform X2 n=1 Tax=Physcomitrium patens TaxID=3218 RepID=UPI003CCD0AF8